MASSLWSDRKPTFPSVSSARRELWPLCRRQPATSEVLPSLTAGNYLFGTSGCAKGGGMSHPLCPVNRSPLISASCVPAESQELLLQQRSSWVTMRMGQAIATLRILVISANYRHHISCGSFNYALRSGSTSSIREYKDRAVGKQCHRWQTSVSQSVSLLWTD